MGKNCQMVWVSELSVVFRDDVWKRCKIVFQTVVYTLFLQAPENSVFSCNNFINFFNSRFLNMEIISDAYSIFYAYSHTFFPFFFFNCKIASV